MKTKNARKDLKCPKKHIFFLETGVPKRGGGGSNIWEKFPKKSGVFWVASLIRIRIVALILLGRFSNQVKMPKIFVILLLLWPGWFVVALSLSYHPLIALFVGIYLLLTFLWCCLSLVFCVDLCVCLSTGIHLPWKWEQTGHRDRLQVQINVEQDDSSICLRISGITDKVKREKVNSVLFKF